jgi:TonB C terminal/HEAT repeats
VRIRPAYHETTKGIKLLPPLPMGTILGPMSRLNPSCAARAGRRATRAARPLSLATLLSLVTFATLAGFGGRDAGATTIAADKLPEAPGPAPVSPAEQSYLKDLHAQVHKRWTDNFLRLVGEKLEPANPLNTADRSAEVDLVIGADGQLVSSKVSRPSGFPGFDDAIIDVLKDAVPFPQPPLAVRSDDDNLHLHWLFARDQRRCAGVAVTHFYDPIDRAVPKLLHAARREEALYRLTVARTSGQPVGPEFTLLANDWAKASLKETWATVRMAKPAAVRGDEDAIRWLKGALKRPDLAGDAAALLTTLKVPICPLVKSAIDGQNLLEQQTAAVGLATSSDGACEPGLLRLLQNAQAPPEARAAAVTALGTIDDAAAKKAIAEALKADNLTLRAAAILAQVRPGAGRVKVIAMERTLRDPSPEVRAASAAGVVRAGGDANLADLYVLFKDGDPRPSLASLRELEHLKTEESTKLIARLLRRAQPEVEKLAADILIRRGARETFSALRPYLDPKTDPQVRGRALIVADDATLRTLAPDPQLGIWVYRARLARGEPDLAADWFIAYGSKLLAPAQAEAMADWAAKEPVPEPAPAPAAAAGAVLGPATAAVPSPAAAAPGPPAAQAGH